ncbi:MAG TPA: glycosyl hydrolase family 18 protein [Candidatus Limnocylindrales bacterium]
MTLVAGAIGWGAGGALLASRPNGAGGSGSGGPGGSGEAGAGGQDSLPIATPRPPTGGTELYGFLPYWEMTDAVAAYLPQVPVGTLALFSVGATTTGGLRHTDLGYERITGPRGLALIADAHGRGQRVDLVFSSFGYRANARLFGGDPSALARRSRAAQELAALATQLGVDGVNVDVELIDGDDNDGYATFLADVGARIRAANPRATLTVATTAGHGGADLARAAVAGGADRVFLMGYDYHWSGSDAGASAPIESRDGSLDLSRSIAAYVDAGVPRTRILLGLPLYGMTWPVAGPSGQTAALGKGATWIPSQHLDRLLAPGFSPWYDFQEVADYFVTPTAAGGWTATYYDTPRTLTPKLALARSQGLAGAGFWALGYEQGLPGYTDVMADFVAGRIGG